MRGYYFDNAPELRRHLLSVPQPERLHVLGLRSGRRQQFVTIAGLVALITSVLTGSAVGVLAAVISDHSLPIAPLAGGPVGALLLAVLMRHQDAAWTRVGTAPLIADTDTDIP